MKFGEIKNQNNKFKFWGKYVISLIFVLILVFILLQSRSVAAYSTILTKVISLDAAWRSSTNEATIIVVVNTKGLLQQITGAQNIRIEEIKVIDVRTNQTIQTLSYNPPLAFSNNFDFITIPIQKGGFNLVDGRALVGIELVDKRNLEPTHVIPCFGLSTCIIKIVEVGGYYYVSSTGLPSIEINFANVDLPKQTNWYVGDIHDHTIYSTNPFEFGADIASTKLAAKDIGLDWLTLTEHSFALTAPEFDQLKSEVDTHNQDFVYYGKKPLLFAGEEISTNDNPERYRHYLAIGINNFIEGDEIGGNFQLTQLTPAQLVSEVNSQNGVGYIAHPYYLDPFRKEWEEDDYGLNFTGMQIWNYETLANQYPPFKTDSFDNGVNKWKQLLKTGRKVYTSGGSDAHGDFNSLLGKVRTYIYSPSGLTQSGVLTALKNGNSFMTNGPFISFTLNSKIIGETKKEDVETKAVLNIEALSTPEFGNLDTIKILRGTKGRDETTPQGGLITGINSLSKSFTFVDPQPVLVDTYYRIETTTTTGYKAYTNPIWLEVDDWATIKQNQKRSGATSMVGDLTAGSTIGYDAVGTGGADAWQFPLIGDIDNDGSQEIITGTIYALEGNMSLKWISPFGTGQKAVLTSQIGDLEKDGTVDILGSAHCSAQIFTLNGNNGALQKYYPEDPPGGQYITCVFFPAFSDVDSNGELDVVFAQMKNVINGSELPKVYALDKNMGVKWQKTMPSGPQGSLAIGDIDNDAKPEIVIGGYDGVYALNAEDGSILWDTTSDPHNIRAIIGTPTITDLDNDGNLEVIVGTFDHEALTKQVINTTNFKNGTFILDGHTGAFKWSYPTNEYIFASPVAVNLDSDPQLEIIITTSENITFMGQSFPTTPKHSEVIAIDSSSHQKQWGFTPGDLSVSDPVAADIDNDGALDIIITSYDGKVYVVSNTGTLKWAYNLGGVLFSSPALGDIDNDGMLEMAIRKGAPRTGGAGMAPASETSGPELKMSSGPLQVSYESATEGQLSIAEQPIPLGSIGPLSTTDFTSYSTVPMAGDPTTSGFALIDGVEQPPTLEVPEEIVVKEGETVSIPANVHDPNNDPFSLSASGPVGNSLNWETKIGDAGKYNVEVNVTDGNSIAAKNLSVIVVPSYSSLLNSTSDGLLTKEFDFAAAGEKAFYVSLPKESDLYYGGFGITGKTPEKTKDMGIFFAEPQFKAEGLIVSGENNIETTFKIANKEPSAAAANTFLELGHIGANASNIHIFKSDGTEITPAPVQDSNSNGYFEIKWQSEQVPAAVQRNYRHDDSARVGADVASTFSNSKALRTKYTLTDDLDAVNAQCRKGGHSGFCGYCYGYGCITWGASLNAYIGEESLGACSPAETSGFGSTGWKEVPKHLAGEEATLDISGGTPGFCVAYLDYDNALTQTCNGDGCSKRNFDNTVWQNAPGDYIVSFDARKYGRLAEKVTFDLTLPLPHDVRVDVANDSDLQFEAMGEFAATRRVLDFSDELKSSLENCVPDASGNCLIPISVKSGSAGTLKSSDLKIYLAPKDVTPPVTADNSPTTWQKDDFAVDLAATDDIRGVAYTTYRVDSGEWINGTAVSINLEGNHTIEYYSTDRAGNIESIKTTYAALDKSSPVVTFIVPTPLNTTIAQDYVNISVTTSENAVSAALEWNSITETMLGSETNWHSDKSGLSDGTYKFKVFVTDIAGNIGSSEERWVAIDTTPPSAIANLSASSITSSSITWSWINPADSDFDHAEIWFNGAFLANNSSNSVIIARLNASTLYEILLRPVDNIGNIGAWANDSARTLAPPSSGASGNQGGGGGGGSGGSACKESEIVQNGKCVSKPENKTAPKPTTTVKSVPQAAPVIEAPLETSTPHNTNVQGTVPTGFIALVSGAKGLATIVGAIIVVGILGLFYFQGKTRGKR